MLCQLKLIFIDTTINTVISLFILKIQFFNFSKILFYLFSENFGFFSEIYYFNILQFFDIFQSSRKKRHFEYFLEIFGHFELIQKNNLLKTASAVNQAFYIRIIKGL